MMSLRSSEQFYQDLRSIRTSIALSPIRGFYKICLAEVHSVKFCDNFLLEQYLDKIVDVSLNQTIDIFDAQLYSELNSLPKMFSSDGELIVNFQQNCDGKFTRELI